jgi:hypothetical protein
MTKKITIVWDLTPQKCQAVLYFSQKHFLQSEYIHSFTADIFFLEQIENALRSPILKGYIFGLKQQSV